MRKKVSNFVKLTTCLKTNIMWKFTIRSRQLEIFKILIVAYVVLLITLDNFERKFKTTKCVRIFQILYIWPIYAEWEKMENFSIKITFYKNNEMKTHYKNIMRWKLTEDLIIDRRCWRRRCSSTRIWKSPSCSTSWLTDSWTSESCYK